VQRPFELLTPAAISGKLSVMKPIMHGHSWVALGGGDAPPRADIAMHETRLFTGLHHFRHPQWVVDYALNTAGHVRVASRSRPWRPRLPRTLHLYPPNTVFWEDYPKGRQTLCDYSYVFFRGGEAAGLGRLIAPHAGYARFLDPDGLAGSLLEEIVRIGQQSGDEGFWQAQAAFCRLIDLLRKSAPTEEAETRLIGHPVPAASPSDLVRKTDAYLSQHLAGPVVRADLAKHMNVSISTLSHRYHAETGETPMTRLMRLRMDRAKMLLLGGQKLAAIAEATGFYDAAHLATTFKHVVGVSPRAYRQGIQKELSEAPGTVNRNRSRTI
jgi:AraC-like DNA-binding protein